MIFHLHTYISYLFRRYLSLRRAPYFLTVAALSVSLTGCASVPLPEGNSAAVTSEAVAEQSWVDRHRELFQGEAPYFGQPGERRAVWSPSELSLDALQRIGLHTEQEYAVNDYRVASVLGLFDHPGQEQLISVLWDWISIEAWPKRTSEWGDNAFVRFSSIGAQNIPIWKLVNLSDDTKDCWMFLDTKYGAIGVKVTRRHLSKTTMDEACQYAATALETYAEEFALWLDEHPEFDPPRDAYGPRD